MISLFNMKQADLYTLYSFTLQPLLLKQMLNDEFNFITLIAALSLRKLKKQRNKVCF